MSPYSTTVSSLNSRSSAFASASVPATNGLRPGRILIAVVAAAERDRASA